MRAVMRRACDLREQLEEVLHVGPVRLDASRREVAVHNVPVELSRKEFDPLALLMTHRGQVVTRDGCINQLWWDQELINSRKPLSPRHRARRGLSFRRVSDLRTAREGRPSEKVAGVAGKSSCMVALPGPPASPTRSLCL